MVDVSVNSAPKFFVGMIIFVLFLLISILIGMQTIPTYNSAAAEIKNDTNATDLQILLVEYGQTIYTLIVTIGLAAVGLIIMLKEAGLF